MNNDELTSGGQGRSNQDVVDYAIIIWLCIFIGSLILFLAGCAMSLPHWGGA